MFFFNKIYNLVFNHLNKKNNPKKTDKEKTRADVSVDKNAVNLMSENIAEKANKTASSLTASSFDAQEKINQTIKKKLDSTNRAVVVKKTLHKNAKIIENGLLKNLITRLKYLIKNISKEKQYVPFQNYTLRDSCAEFLQSHKLIAPTDILLLSDEKLLKSTKLNVKILDELISISAKIGTGITESGQLALRLNLQNNWVSYFLAEFPNYKEKFKALAIHDDKTYLVNWQKLDDFFARQVDAYRYDYIYKYINHNNPLEVLKIMSHWLLEEDLSQFAFSEAIEKFIAENNLETISDFAKFTIDDLYNEARLGRKTIKLLAENLDNVQKKNKAPAIEDKPIIEGIPENIKIKEINETKENIENTFSSETLLSAFNNSINSIKDKNTIYILEHRLGVDAPIKTQNEIARQIGVSTARVWQIIKKSTAEIIKNEFWCDILESKLTKLLDNEETPLYVSELTLLDPWFADFEDKEELLKNIIINFSSLKLHLLQLDNRLVFSYLSNADWKKNKAEMLNSFKLSLDVQYTMEDIEMLIENRLEALKSKNLASRFYAEIQAELNYQFDGENLVLTSIGHSVAHNIFSLLNEAAAPISSDELLDIYQNRFATKLTKAYLRASLKNGRILRFDKDLYGTEKHIKMTTEQQGDILLQAEEFLQRFSFKEFETSQIIHFVNYEEINAYILHNILQKSKKITCVKNMTWVSGNANR